jgi:hypothetical protein
MRDLPTYYGDGNVRRCARGRVNTIKASTRAAAASWFHLSFHVSVVEYTLISLLTLSQATFRREQFSQERGGRGREREPGLCWRRMARLLLN